MSLASTAAELRSRARDLRTNTNWDHDELAAHLSAMATEIDQAARRRKRRSTQTAPKLPNTQRAPKLPNTGRFVVPPRDLCG